MSSVHRRGPVRLARLRVGHAEASATAVPGLSRDAVAAEELRPSGRSPSRWLRDVPQPTSRCCAQAGAEILRAGRLSLGVAVSAVSYGSGPPEGGTAL